MMLDKLKHIEAKIDQMSLRERILILMAILIVVFQGWDSLIWQPMLDKQYALQETEIQINSELTQTQVDMKLLTAKANIDPDRDTKKKIESLLLQLQALNKKIDETSASLVSPSEMAKLLEQLLTREKGLELVQLQTLDSIPLIPVDEKKKIKMSYQIYRHNFSIEFEGGYLATLRYIEELEKLPWEFFWDGIEYKVNEYPNSKVQIKLYTLSLSEGWIGV